MLLIIFLVLAAGAVGGLVSSLVDGAFHLPHKDAEAQVYRPGWLGNVAVGAIAAVMLWGLYGPQANEVLVGAGTHLHDTVLKVSELAGALVSGIGGSRLLAAEVDKAALSHEKTALSNAKANLAASITQLSE